MGFCQGHDENRKATVKKIADGIGRMEKGKLEEIIKQSFYRLTLRDWDDYDPTKQN